MLLARLFPWFAAAQKPHPMTTDFCDLYPGDLSWIQKMASIGDSYAAGLGSGTRVDFSCSRYSTAYPTILHDLLRWCGSNTTYQSLACSGADTTEILAKQIPALNSTSFNLITISAGGNDIGLTPILSNCVYQFYMAGEDACQKSIDEAREKVADDTQLFQDVTRLVEAAKSHLNTTNGMVYLTGYARFFGTEDDTCNNVTWAVWRNIEHTKQYLKLEMRQALNNLVLDVNAVLHRAVQAAGPNVHFIDYDLWVAIQRGRYCEAGVHEPDPNRWGLMFYEWDTVDMGENKTDLQNRTGDGVPKGSFEGGIAEQINKTLQEHPDWTFDKDRGFVKKNETGVGEKGIIGDTIHWMIPDSYKRVFHMRRHGHQIVAGEIWNDLKARVRTHTSEIEEL